MSLYPYWTICLILSAVVNELLGRIVAVQPETQMVEPIVAWVTAGLSAPGVKAGSGSPGSRSVAAAPLVGGTMPVALGANEAPGLLEVSSSVSVPDATADAESAIVGVEVLTDVEVVALAVRGGVVVILAEVTGDAVEAEAQPAARRTTTAMEAQVCNRGLDRRRAPSPASVFFVVSCAEPTLGSNPCRDLLPIGIVAPLPLPHGHATATKSDRLIVLGSWAPCARSDAGIVVTQ